ncbi:hypothetical protein [Microbacterium allomyrinae]|uniref:Tail terminator n=1 Tax=Microbacterium allomyrinae TaxID=2830666 RepID=A0A9X1LVG3_9MICO|nr:hypothetical protein [Microbacterium allomyrinae]MCC2032195.1 hypothetical protein [Microbacterium allomyrinae]
MSDDQTVRAYLVEQLNLPDDWLVIPEQRFPETLSVTTVVLQHTRIEHLAAAPIGNLEHQVVLSVLDPHTDIAAAENALDDAVTEVIGRIDAHSRIGWTTADKVMHRDTYPAWNITLTVITGRPPLPAPPEAE